MSVFLMFLDSSNGKENEVVLAIGRDFFKIHSRYFSESLLNLPVHSTHESPGWLLAWRSRHFAGLCRWRRQTTDFQAHQNFCLDYEQICGQRSFVALGILPFGIPFASWTLFTINVLGAFVLSRCIWATCLGCTLAAARCWGIF